MDSVRKKGDLGRVRGISRPGLMSKQAQDTKGYYTSRLHSSIYSCKICGGQTANLGRVCVACLDRVLPMKQNTKEDDRA